MGGKRRSGGGDGPRSRVQQRVADEIRMKVGELLLREVRDPRVRGVHLTDVSVSADLGSARLSWRPLPGSATAEEAEVGLRAAAGFLRRELGRSMNIRHVPELDFELDPTPEEGDRIDDLLAEFRRSGSAGTLPSSADSAQDSSDDSPDGRDED